MKQFLKTLGCLTLLAAMLVSMMTAFAESVTETDETGPASEENVLDFIILLDCSYSGGKNDREKLYMDACKNFIDKLPVQDVRVGVVAFGYQDEKLDKVTSDVDQVHELIPLGPLDRDDSSRRNFKKKLQDAVEYGQAHTLSFSPIGHALTMGVDMLEAGGARDGDAVIILISDGVWSAYSNEYSDKRSPYKDSVMIDKAMAEAKERNWPICSIQLNYSNSDKNEAEQATAFMAKLGKNNVLRDRCKATARSFACSNPVEVHIAFVKVFNYAYGIDGPEPVQIKLPYTYEIDVPNLASEISLDVFGDNVTQIDIAEKNGDFKRSIDHSIKETNLVTVVEPGSYFSVKLICPPEGKWIADIQGEGEAIAYVSHSTLQEMGLQMNVSADGRDLQSLTRQDTLYVNAYFAYKGIEVHESSYYGDTSHQAEVLLHKDGEEASFASYIMNGDEKGGYSYEIPLKELKQTGNLLLQVVLKDNMFLNSEKRSKTEMVRLDPKPLQLIKSDSMTRNSSIDVDFSEINLTEIFRNPDGDPVTYTLRCAERNIPLEYTVDNDYLLIKAFPTAGSYHMEITGQDPDLAEPLVYSLLTLEVVDREPDVKVIDPIELWTDKYSFQTISLDPVVLDLNNYFSDPDKHTLRYEISTPNGETTEIAQLTHNDNMLTVSAGKTGTGSVVISASDDANTVSQTVEIRVESGIQVFWARYWLPIVVAVIVLLASLIVFIVLLRNKTIKGVWEFTFEKDSLSYLVDADDIKNTISRKRKMSLKELLVLASQNVTDDPNLPAELSTAFDESAASKIMVKGVMRKAGCKVVRVPSGIVISLNGRTGKSFNVRRGDLLAIDLDDENGGKLSARIVVS